MNAIQKNLILCLTVCGIGLSGSAFADQSTNVQKKGGFCVAYANMFSDASEYKFTCDDISKKPLTIKEIYNANWRVVGVINSSDKGVYNSIIIEQQ
jgi:hypothetical protein